MRRALPALVVVFALTHARRSHADDMLDPNEPPGAKSEGTALALSVGGTLGSWALLGIGIEYDNGPATAIGMIGVYLAPTTGEIYADSGFSRGFGARTLGLVSVATGYAVMVDACESWNACHHDRPPLATGLLSAGVLLFAAGTIDDLVRAPAAVRRHNRMLDDLAIAPVVGPDRAGVALAGTF